MIELNWKLITPGNLKPFRAVTSVHIYCSLTRYYTNSNSNHPFSAPSWDFSHLTCFACMINCFSLVHLSFVSLIFSVSGKELNGIERKRFSSSSESRVIPATEQRRGKLLPGPWCLLISHSLLCKGDEWTFPGGSEIRLNLHSWGQLYPRTLKRKV